MSEIIVDAISNLAETRQASADAVIAGCAKAWVNFNGTGTVAIRDSYNVASITDNGTGDYTINFTTPLNSASVVVTGSAGTPASVNGFICAPLTSAFSTTAVRIGAVSVAGALFDPSNCTAAIFQD